MVDGFLFREGYLGRRVKVLMVMDEYTRKVFEPKVGYSMRGRGVVEHLRILMEKHGRPEYLRMDHGPEFRSKAMGSYSWIDSYNSKRPHSSLGYYVPQVIWERT